MKKPFVFIVGLIFTVLNLEAQNDQRALLDEIAGRLIEDINRNNAEWIYLHHDKPVYESGGTIWFKTYILNSVSQQLSANKNNLYVDLLDPNDSVVQMLVLNGTKRELDGGLKIPGKIREGFYTIRAYTMSIANGSPELAFREKIFIFNPEAVQDSEKDIVSTGATGDAEPQVMFFPEGGSLVNGIDNRIYVTAKIPDGPGVLLSGRIYDDNNRMITPFSTDSAGIGIFSFAPVKNRTYTALIHSTGGKEKKIPLPPINYRASQLNLVSQNANALKLRVVLGDSLYAGKPVSYLLGVSRGKLCYASIGTGMYETDVPVKNFPSGVATFYLFDGKRNKTSERKVIIDKQDVKVDIIPDRTNYAARQLINTEIRITDESGKPVSAIFSVSVTDDRFAGDVKNMPRFTRLRKFDEVDLVKQNGDLSTFGGNHPESADTSVMITGKVNKSNGDAAAGYVMTMFAGGTDVVLSDTLDVNGEFSFRDMEFADQTPFLAQITDSRGIKQDGQILTDFRQAPDLKGKPLKSNRLNIAETLSKFRSARADSFLYGPTRAMLEYLAANAGSKKKNKNSPAVNNSFSRMITAEQLDKLGLNNTVNAVMMLPGVIMVGGKLTIRGGMQIADARGGGSSGGVEPLLLIDGVPSGGGSVVNQLNSINPQTIQSIEVLTGGDAGQYGTRGANGVIILKTANILRPVASGEQKGMQYIFPKGYHRKPLFFIPRYEINEVRDAAFMDNRSTIYWNPETLTDAQGKARLNFYSADLPSAYSFRIVGITSKGDLIDQMIRLNRN